MKKILWVSQRKPLSEQVQKLAEIFGCRVQIVIKLSAYPEAEDIKSIYEGSNYNDIVIAEDDKSLIFQLTEFGISPLWPEMVKTDKGARFERFRRIQGVVDGIFEFV